MTTTKTETPKAKQPSKELQTAHEIHTLAQTIYRHLAYTHPWVASVSAASVFTPPVEWPPTQIPAPSSGWVGASPWSF